MWPSLQVLRNPILSNSIFSNEGLGIDLNNDGVTSNDQGDPDTGANNLQNYPVLTSAVTDSTTLVQGTFNGLPNQTFFIEFFSNDVADPSGFGEGQTLLGFQRVSTNSSGDATISFVSPTLVPPGKFVTSTATLLEVGETEVFVVETSEFSNAVEVTGPTVDLADLSLSKTVNDPRPNVGDEITFTLTLFNAGPDDATRIVVTDLLPAGFSFVDASQDSYNAGTGVWTVGTLPFDETETLTITAVLTGADASTNIAEVTASDQSDPTPSDNLATVTVTPQQADLSLVKTVDNNAAVVGENVTFAIAVNNAGPDEASGVNLLDLLPEGLQFVGGTTDTGKYNQETGVWNIGNLADDSTATLEIIATLTTQQSVTNTAEIVASDQFDPDPEDNQFSVIVGACLTGGPLSIGMNRLTYSCVTPGGYAAFVMGTETGSYFFDRWGSTVDIADPSVPAIGVGNIDGVAVVLVEISEAQLDQDLIFQAFEMVPEPKVSNVLRPDVTNQLVGIPLRADGVGVGGEPLSSNSLPALVVEAIDRWAASGVSADVLQLLHSLDVRISDLPGDQLASTSGKFVLIDKNAAGHGWFIDASPNDDAEFVSSIDDTLVATAGPASDRIERADRLDA